MFDRPGEIFEICVCHVDQNKDCQKKRLVKPKRYASYVSSVFCIVMLLKKTLLDFPFVLNWWFADIMTGWPFLLLLLSPHGIFPLSLLWLFCSDTFLRCCTHSCCAILNTNCLFALEFHYYYLLNISQVVWNDLYQDIVSWVAGWVHRAASGCSSPKESRGVCRPPRPPWCWWPGWAAASPGPSRPPEPPASRSRPRKVRPVLLLVRIGTPEERCCSSERCLLQQIPCPDQPILDWK